MTNSDPPNHESVYDLESVTYSKLNSELESGRLKGPFDEPPFEPFHVSPMKLVEKSVEGTYRMIHNLSCPYDETAINHGIPDSSKTVKYAGLKTAIHKIMKHPKGSYTFKTDIKHAFKLIPIHHSEHHKLGIKFYGKYYYDTTLGQGAGSACRIFERFSTALDAIHCFDTNDDSSTHYLDDFFFICLTLILSAFHRQLFDKLCDDIGVPQAMEKKTDPSHTTDYLGITLDSLNWKAYLPQTKLESYKDSIYQALIKKRMTQKELQSLVGKLNHASSVVPARAFLRRLIDKISSVKKPRHYIKITRELRDDLNTWLQFLENYNGVTYFRALQILPSDHLNMASDASIKGYGATFGNKWIQDEYPIEWQNLMRMDLVGSSFIEIYPIYALIMMFGHNLLNSSILFKTDNKGVESIINKQSSKCPYIMQIVRPLVLALVSFNISLRSEHVPGLTHILCDRISRFQVTTQLLRSHHMEMKETIIPDHLKSRNFKLL